MELRHLRYALAVAEHGRFSRAARALGMAQPPLSRQVSRTEAELGFRLFDRTPEGVRMTVAGENFLDRARTILLDLELAADDARRIAQRGSGTLRLGVIGSALVDPLPTVLSGLRVRHPGVRIECHELSSRASTAALIAGEIDVALCRGGPSGPGAERLSAAPVRGDHLVLLCHRAHPFASQPRITWAQLAGESVVIATPDDEPAVQDALADLLLDRDPTSITRARDMNTVAGLVACGVGVAPLPSGIRALPRPETRVVDLVPARRLPELQMVHRRDDENPLVATFLDLATRGTDRA